MLFRSDLFLAAVRMGAFCGGADGKALGRLTDYAVRLGLAFQLVDDLLDGAEASDPSAAPDGATALLLFDAAEVRHRAGAHIDAALAALSSFGPPAEPLRAIARFVLARRA